MENLAVIKKCLGGAKAVGSPKSDMDFVSAIRRGFPFSSLTSVAAWIDITDEAAFDCLRIPQRTGARRKAKGERLKPVESERLLRLARVSAAAANILGSKDNARGWLTAENRALGGVKPISLLDTEIGAQQVLTILGRIQYGVYS